MKVLQINKSDLDGGAAKAAFRINKALIDIKVNSKMFVDRAKIYSEDVITDQSVKKKISSYLKSKISNKVVHILKKAPNNQLSISIFNSDAVKKINNKDIDVINLHWINDEMLSIKDLSKLNKPLAWTFHDMWPLCGVEHYSSKIDWKNGFSNSNDFLDIDRITWNRKKRHWSKEFRIITPSKWLKNQAKMSPLFNDNEVVSIPNCIDYNFWDPIDTNIARKYLKLPLDEPILLFGAMEANDRRKGFDLLIKALKILENDFPDLNIVTFGRQNELKDISLKHYSLGFLNDEAKIKMAYSAANAFVLPSRLDNLPNTGLESQACSTPIVAFDVGGISDIVTHNETGYLAEAFNVEDFAYGILNVIKDPERNKNLSQSSRKKAIENWSPSIVANAYKAVYQSMI